MANELERQVRLCSDCPPMGYPTDETRCAECPRRAANAIAALSPVPDDVAGLVHKFTRYAEIIEDDLTRVHQRKAGNTWSEGFRKAVEVIRSQANRIADLEAEVSRLPTQVRRDALEALVTYGDHKRSCPVVWEKPLHDQTRCDCGFGQILRNLSDKTP